MCGVAGFLNWQQGDLEITAGRMADALIHRGPDDGGTWVSADAGIGLAHRRLAIIDLSENGRQPMLSEDKQWIIAYNGEVYNHSELRDQLEKSGHRFRGHSDTEVMLAAFQEWGVAAAVSRFNGMFAFALWNQSSKTLYLGRDRLGQKPLYYGWCGGAFLFGSELKALRAHPAFRPELDREALVLYFRCRCVPAPRSIYRGIFKLPAGTVLTLQAKDLRSLPEPVPYWSLQTAAQQGLQNRYASIEEAAEDLDWLLRSAVKMRMISDVPLGAFLSGGVDSSLVVALMQRQSHIPVRTFSIGFPEHSHNEAPHARAVAQHLATDHTELYVTANEAMNVIPRLAEIFDEPFADSSQIPTFLVSKLTRRYVTVALSGDGGDEMFAGYHSYRTNAKFKARYGGLPRIARRLSSSALNALMAETWDKVFRGGRWIIPPGLRRNSPGERLQRLAVALQQDTDAGLHAALTSAWVRPETIVRGATRPEEALLENVPPGCSFVETMMYLDLQRYLPDDILVKVDRASMAVALEARSPLLDYRVAEFAWRVPLAMKLSGTENKILLRKVLHRYVPPNLVERPKAGFAVPIAEWLRGSLRPWAEELLSERRLSSEGILHPKPIRRLWEQHQRREADWSAQLWTVAMFQAWRQQAFG